MSRPDVSIVVVPRERFQFAARSLDSLLEHTRPPFELIYVDNRSPADWRRFLAARAREHGFTLLRSRRFLSPNQARNLGARAARGRYVVFVDNDVVFTPGWLERLVACADEEGATVAAPLVCQWEPVHEVVHCAGGSYLEPADFERFRNEPLGSRAGGPWRIRETIDLQDARVEDVRPALARRRVGFVEFHCLLVRKSFLEEIGYLDEAMLCTKEYLDLCMTAERSGGRVFLEPASVVSFLTHPPAEPIRWRDVPYFMLRWSDAWERSSLHHFRDKWHLEEDEYFLRRYRRLGWRRRHEMVKPLLKRALGRRGKRALLERAVRLEKRLNPGVTRAHALAVGWRRDEAHAGRES